MITLYTREGCYYCNEAKKSLAETGKTFKEIIIGKDVTRDEVIMKFPDQKVLPIVVVNEEVIGTYANLLDYLYPALGDFENDDKK